MSAAVDILSVVLLLVGAVFTLIGGTGLLRLPDFFTRLHGASVTDTLGAGAILLGLALAAGWGLLMGKILALLLIMALLSPSAAHALARAAIHGIRRPWLDETQK
jgi:multicomponent Na+:H+ antiporter subunit G